MDSPSTLDALLKGCAPVQTGVIFGPALYINIDIYIDDHRGLALETMDTLDDIMSPFTSSLHLASPVKCSPLWGRLELRQAGSRKEPNGCNHVAQRLLSLEYSSSSELLPFLHDTGVTAGDGESRIDRAV